jgi:hypothetical protein
MKNIKKLSVKLFIVIAFLTISVLPTFSLNPQPEPPAFQDIIRIILVLLGIR